MATESDLKLEAAKLAVAVGWIVRDLRGVNGSTDKIYIRGGRCWVAEFKDGDNGVISEDQYAEEARMIKNGTPHYFIRNLNEFLVALQEQENG